MQRSAADSVRRFRIHGWSGGNTTTNSSRPITRLRTACVSHKSPTLAEDLRVACPAGIDAYFENVGGQVFTAVLPLLNRQARISLCGLVSQYGTATQGDPHDTWMAEGVSTFERQHVQVHRLHVRNFVDEHQAHFLAQMAAMARPRTLSR